MKVSVHLSFDGQCEAAFATYARALNGTIVYSLRYGDSPMADQVPEDWRDKLYHATLQVGHVTLLGGDLLPRDYQGLRGYSLVVNPVGPDDARRVFDALAEGGSILTPIQRTFWSPAFGVVTDRFGVQWEINCEDVAQPA